MIEIENFEFVSFLKEFQMEIRNMNAITIMAVIALMASVATASKSYPVTTLLNAKYNVTPVCLEIAEYLFDENPNLYWDYVDNLNQLKTPLYEIGKLMNAPQSWYGHLQFFLHLQMAIRKPINHRFRRLRA